MADLERELKELIVSALASKTSHPRTLTVMRSSTIRLLFSLLATLFILSSLDFQFVLATASQTASSNSSATVTFEIDRIPAVMVWGDAPVAFHISAPVLGKDASFDLKASPPPSGKLTLDKKTDAFSFALVLCLVNSSNAVE